MGGGLMQLVAYGAQDIYLTGNPQITFFKVVYRRHTNFSMEAIEQTLSGNATYGNKATSTISRNGDLANWIIPKRGIGSIGGAMDLAANAKRVVIAMEHTARGDTPKIVEECTFPLTAPGCVDEIITDIAVIEIDHESGRMILRETAPGWSFDDVQARTEATLVIDGEIIEIS